MALAWAGGCRGASRASEPPAAFAIQSGRTRQISGELARVAEDIRRAASNLGWGVRRTASRFVSVGNETSPLAAVTAQVVMPDDRVMSIEAVSLNAGTVDISATVHPFGDRRREAEFLNELARVLAGPPARQYGGHFELPSP